MSGWKMSPGRGLSGLLLLCCLGAEAFYLPGVAVHEYARGDPVTIKVNSVKSVRTAIPYDYYSLMFCRPEVKGKTLDYRNKIKHEPENLGEILWGESIKASAYKASMKMDVSCRKLCTTRPDMFLKKGQQTFKNQKRNPLRRLKQRIDDEYRGHLILDNLPVAEVLIWEKASTELYYRRGYPLGVKGNATDPTIVNNHLRFTIKYHKPADLTDSLSGSSAQSFRIVSFDVVATSIDSAKIDSDCSEYKEFEYWKYAPQTLVVNMTTKNKKGPIPIVPPKLTTKISWSYSVKWEEDPDVTWVSRWDHYLKSAEAASSQIHWFSIVNSSLVVLVLSVMVATIMSRTLHRDFNRYNNPDNEYETEEETGWKLVHGDVFRDPENAKWLHMYIGVGMQLLAVGSITLVFACLGFLSPANRGAMMTALVFFYIISGVIGGYVTGVFQKLHSDVNWTTPFCTAVVVPGKIFGVFLCLNLVMFFKQASNAVPFSTLFILILLWFAVSAPLVLLGARMGFRSELTWMEPPLEVNSVPRVIPPQPWFMKAHIAIPCAGLVPFMACFIEVTFILSSLWQHKFYYVFGFFTIVFLILIVACAETAIVGTYFQLCFGDYHWWWRSFYLTASCGPILFAYSAYYFFTVLKLGKFWSMVLYFSYMACASYLFAIFTGTIGMVASYIFVLKIYSVLKVA